MRPIFSKLDVNDDGRLSEKEFPEGLRKMGLELKTKDVKLLVTNFAKNDGSMSYPDFLQLVDPVVDLKALEAKLQRALSNVAASRKELQEVFAQFDENDDGHLSFTEFREMCEVLGLPLSDDEVCVLMDCLDTSKGE